MFCSAKCFSEHDPCVSDINEAVEKPVLFERRYKRTDNNDLNLTEEDTLTDECLDIMSKDEELREFLQNPSIQRILSRLDTARDRRGAFSKIYESSADFVAVVDRITAVLVQENVFP